MTNLKITICIAAVALASPLRAGAADAGDLALPIPRTEGGMPLMQALKQRQSNRAFSTTPLPPQVLSDLLWAAFGINRPDSDKRTAPSARNWQEIEVYAVMEEAAYLYDAKANTLKLVVEGDLRGVTGRQEYVGTAPLNLVYVADTEKMKGSAPEDQTLYAAADAGFISQNVYLFCASEGLSTVVRGLVDREALAEALGLPPHKKIILSQTIGYPARDAQ